MPHSQAQGNSHRQQRTTVRQPRSRLSKALFLAFALACASPHGAFPHLNLGGNAQAASLSQSDQDIYIQAFAQARRGQWPSAISLADQARSPLLRDVLLWRYMQQSDSGYGFETISGFITTHPDWPGKTALLRRAEDAMNGTEPPQKIIKWFTINPPFSAKGKMMLAEALVATGKSEQAQEIIRDAWVNEAFSREDEQRFLSEFSSYLTPDHHRRRLNTLLWNDHDVSAERMLRLVSPDLQALAKARLALQRLDSSANSLIAQVPTNLRSDPGLLFDRVYFRRKKDLDDEAAELLKDQDADTVRPRKWWNERSILSRRFLARGHITMAYRIAANHKMSSGSSYAEAEWLAGWIALRFLKDADTALKHFKRADAVVSYPISVGRAAYWTGRASEEAGLKDEAIQWYAKAAEQATSYYGQLAAARLPAGRRPGLPQGPVISDKDRKDFSDNSLVEIVRALNQIGEEDQARPFLYRLTEDAPTEGQRALAVSLGGELGRPDISVAMSRRAALKGTHVLDIAYPIPRSLTLPNQDPEKALVLSIIRQESNFHAQAVSSAGALGLMQLMPETAQHLAKKEKIPHSTNQLTSDPSHNVRLGSTYLGNLINGFQGSYIMAIAGYNAGPGRPKRWVQEFGDPRRGEIDPIDWVEMIPFNETRNYVQRVLESVAIYRARLSKGDLNYSIEQDLKRGG